MSYKDAYEKHVAPKSGEGYAEADADAAAPEATPEISTGEALGRGAAQGATFNFGDEATGLIQALGNKITGYHEHEANPPNLLEDYKAERDAARGLNDQTKKSHPIAYLGGEIGGGIVSTLPVAGSGALRGLKAIVGAGAGLGALSGLGGSRAELTTKNPQNMPEGLLEAAKDTGVGAGIGAVSSAAGYGLASGLGLVGKKLADTGRGIGELFGREPAVDLGRAAGTLGVKPGQATADPLIRDALESGAVDRLAPSTFNEVSSRAPAAIANVASRPEIKVAEDAAKHALRAGAKLATSQAGKATDTTAKAAAQGDVDLLQALAARKLHPNGISDLISGASSKLGRVGRAIQDVVGADSSNLARALANPTKARELALLLAAGREPNLGADAVKALTSRAMSIISSPEDEPDSTASP